MSYGEIWTQARLVAASIAQYGQEGDRIALFYPVGLEFIGAFLGCLLANRIAVPVNIPKVSSVKRCVQICQDAGLRYALARAEDIDHCVEMLPAEEVNLDWIATGSLCVDAHSSPILSGLNHSPLGENIALLQYTSGSTVSPRGVMVSHSNIMANLRLKAAALRLNHLSSFVSWLPFHHDAGLIWGQLLPIFLGCEATILTPRSFVRRPLLWLEAISRYQAVVSAAPDFAYELCASAFREDLLVGCDLSNWRVAINAADVVRYKTLIRFREAFARYGYNSQVMHPCYGLAEATLFVSGGSVQTRSVDQRILAEEGRVVDRRQDNGSRMLVASGVPSKEVELAIVDPETHSRKESDGVGEIWLRSPSVAEGYWNNREETVRVFRAHLADSPGKSFLRTGDLGFVSADDGHLYVCGRLKDVIIFNGRKICAEDVETSIHECDSSITTLGCAVFQDVMSDSSRVIAVVEVKSLSSTDTDMVGTLKQKIRRKVGQEHEISLGEVIFVPRGSIQRTTSGKIQRGATRDLFRQRKLPSLG